VKGEWQVLNDDLLKKVRALGFQAEYLLFDYTDPADMMNKIRHHVSAGMPLIASQRTALNFPGGHSRLIVGFEDATSDGKEARVVVHDPSTVIRQGVPRGGSYVKWTASNFATFWKPKGVITTGGIAVAMRK